MRRAEAWLFEWLLSHAVWTSWKRFGPGIPGEVINFGKRVEICADCDFQGVSQVALMVHVTYIGQKDNSGMKLWLEMAFLNYMVFYQ